MSVIAALKHSAIEAGVDLVIEWIESTDLEENRRKENSEKFDLAWQRLKSVQGVLVPGGFGTRGIEGMIAAAKYCRESNTKANSEMKVLIDNNIIPPSSSSCEMIRNKL
jgi:CTP synthase